MGESELLTSCTSRVLQVLSGLGFTGTIHEFWEKMQQDSSLTFKSGVGAQTQETLSVGCSSLVVASVRAWSHNGENPKEQFPELHACVVFADGSDNVHEGFPGKHHPTKDCRSFQACAQIRHPVSPSNFQTFARQSDVAVSIKDASWTALQIGEGNLSRKEGLDLAVESNKLLNVKYMRVKLSPNHGETTLYFLRSHHTETPGIL